LVEPKIVAHTTPIVRTDQAVETCSRTGSASALRWRCGRRRVPGRVGGVVTVDGNIIEEFVGEE